MELLTLLFHALMGVITLVLCGAAVYIGISAPNSPVGIVAWGVAVLFAIRCYKYLKVMTELMGVAYAKDKGLKVSTLSGYDRLALANLDREERLLSARLAAAARLQRVLLRQLALDKEKATALALSLSGVDRKALSLPPPSLGGESGGREGTGSEVREMKDALRQLKGKYTEGALRTCLKQIAGGHLPLSGNLEATGKDLLALAEKNPAAFDQAVKELRLL